MLPSIQITPDLASLRPFDSNKLHFDPASFTSLPTPPGTLQQSHHLVSPRHLPTLDLNQNWSSPNFYLSPGNPSVNQNLGSAFLSGHPGFQYENSPLQARHSAAAMAAYGARRSAPISVTPGSSAPWDPSSLPVGPLSFVGTRSEIIRNKPSIMSKLKLFCLYDRFRSFYDALHEFRSPKRQRCIRNFITLVKRASFCKRSVASHFSLYSCIGSIPIEIL